MRLKRTKINSESYDDECFEVVGSVGVDETRSNDDCTETCAVVETRYEWARTVEANEL